MNRVLLIVNPISGRGKGSRLAPKLAERLAALGVWTEIYTTKGPGDAQERASRVNGKTDLVLAVGGDGTLNEIINGLPRKLPLALFPVGTANVMAMELGIPRTGVEFSNLMQAGTFTEIDLIRANGRLGFFSLGVGFDGMVIRELHEQRKGDISRATYIPIVARCLSRYKTPNLTVVVDGKTHEAVSQVIVANTLHYGGRTFKLSSSRKLDDGLYECYLFRGTGRLALLRYMLRSALGSFDAAADPAVIRGKQIEIHSKEPVPYQIDGEYGGTTPVAIEVVPKGMKILTP